MSYTSRFNHPNHTVWTAVTILLPMHFLYTLPLSSYAKLQHHAMCSHKTRDSEQGSETRQPGFYSQQAGKFLSLRAISSWYQSCLPVIKRPEREADRKTLGYFD